jgi:hypothetical protein
MIIKPSHQVLAPPIAKIKPKRDTDDRDSDREKNQ